ncbi:immunity 49 family protein [Streptomyces sp. SCSIO 30461]|uniref:immunity 49 family protein n=1 Tax=Streptomyces sp. SCSIO 30461 TaxID=3118085 RepID=UPI0030D5978B
MTVRVMRHGAPGPDDEAYADGLKEGLIETISALGHSPRMFPIALDQADMHVRARLAVNPDASDLRTWEAVVTEMQLGSALFATASRSEGEVLCRIHDEMRTIPATGPQYYTHAGNWLTAFWLAIVCREQGRMTQLCEFPLEVLRDSEKKYDEYLYLWIDVLQAYWLERPGLGEKLIATIEASASDCVRIADPDMLDKILYQPISLFHRFLRKDHDGFNRVLVEALELHKSFWTESEEREEAVDGYLSLGLLAISCLAYDAGFPIDVESDYIPSELLKRAWLGEFPT